MKKIILATLLSFSSIAFAQSADSSDITAMTAAPQPIGASGAGSSNVLSVPPAVEAGTICGISKDGAGTCQGHNPAVSCPSGYRSAFFGWRGEGTNVCVKN